MTARDGAAHHWLWRRYARAYDALLGLAGYEEMLQAVVAAAGPLDGLCVVEVGCGTGNVAARLLESRAERFTGIDFSGPMLAPARRKLAGAVAQGHVSLVEADAVDGLGALPAASVDLLVVSNVLYALPDRPGFWREAARVVAPAGRVVVSDPDRPGFAPAVRQQWRERGAGGFTDPRLLEVAVLNVAIDLLARTGRYSFPGWDRVAAEAATVGFHHALLHARCYGGAVDGMNVVGTLSRA